MEPLGLDGWSDPRRKMNQTIDRGLEVVGRAEVVEFLAVVVDLFAPDSDFVVRQFGGGIADQHSRLFKCLTDCTDGIVKWGVVGTLGLVVQQGSPTGVMIGLVNIATYLSNPLKGGAKKMSGFLGKTLQG